MDLHCLVIDDEPLARKGITNYIRDTPFLSLVGEAADPLQALPLIHEHTVDLLFLDIRMPKMSGLELLRSLSAPPLTIIVTAYPNHALESYDLDVLDYLIKPVPFERFLKAANKAKELFTLRSAAAIGPMRGDDHVFIKCDGRYEKVAYDELLYAEAMQNYVVLHTSERKLVTYLTFKDVEEHLPSERFLKVHRSYLVARTRVESIDGNSLWLAGKEIPIGRSNREEVMNEVLRNKVLKR